MSIDNSDDGSSLLEKYLQIGTRVSSFGVQKTSTNVGDPDHLLTLQRLPKMFQTESHVLLELRKEEINNQMGKSYQFQKRKGIDEAALDVLTSTMRLMEPCTRMDVAEGLEVIASTFQIQVPNEIGIEVYLSELTKYPLFVYKDAVKSILVEYKYPRLPLPREFVERCEPEYQAHKKWLESVVNAFISLERFIESGGELKPSKYLLDYIAKK